MCEIQTGAGRTTTRTDEPSAKFYLPRALHVRLPWQ